jgi:hypothetical protein
LNWVSSLQCHLRDLTTLNRILALKEGFQHCAQGSWLYRWLFFWEKVLREHKRLILKWQQQEEGSRMYQWSSSRHCDYHIS